MINKMLKEYRERANSLRVERREIRNFINKLRSELESFYNKYYDLEKMLDYIKPYLLHRRIIDINSNDIFYFSNMGEKVFPFEKKHITLEGLNNFIKKANKELKFYYSRTSKYCELIQLNIHKLERLEENFYKSLYTIDYLEYGAKSIDLNNQMKYSYYFTFYYNTFCGFESTQEKLNPVKFSEEDILKFIHENEEQSF